MQESTAYCLRISSVLVHLLCLDLWSKPTSLCTTSKSRGVPKYIIYRGDLVYTCVKYKPWRSLHHRHTLQVCFSLVWLIVSVSVTAPQPIPGNAGLSLTFDKKLTGGTSSGVSHQSRGGVCLADLRPSSILLQFGTRTGVDIRIATIGVRQCPSQNAENCLYISQYTTRPRLTRLWLSYGSHSGRNLLILRICQSTCGKEI